MRKLPQRRPAPGLGAPLGPSQVWRTVELGPDRVEIPLTPTTIQGLDRAGAGFFQLGPDGVETPPPNPSRPAVVESLSPDRYKVQFTASVQLRDKLERLLALMRSEVPDGDLATIIEKAVTEKLERLEARRYATTSAPRKELGDTDTSPTSRHIPAAARRAVRERDGNRCGYVDERGRRSAKKALARPAPSPSGIAARGWNAVVPQRARSAWPGPPTKMTHTEAARASRSFCWRLDAESRSWTERSPENREQSRHVVVDTAFLAGSRLGASLAWSLQ